MASFLYWKLSEDVINFGQTLTNFKTQVSFSAIFEDQTDTNVQ